MKNNNLTNKKIKTSQPLASNIDFCVKVAYIKSRLYA